MILDTNCRLNKSSFSINTYVLQLTKVKRRKIFDIYTTKAITEDVVLFYLALMRTIEVKLWFAFACYIERES